MTNGQTRAEEHADSPTYQVRYSRRTVVRALETGHRGRENAISGRDLARYVPIAYTTVRDVIAELRDDPQGPPIGDCGDGYFVIETRAELEAWADGKQDEIATKKQRLQSNIRSFNRRKL